MSEKCSALVTWREPWNMKCSNRCAKPVRPAVSWRDPTTYQRLTATTGARWSGATITRRPLGSVRWLNWMVGRSGTARIVAPRHLTGARSSSRGGGHDPGSGRDGGDGQACAPAAGAPAQPVGLLGRSQHRLGGTGLRRVPDAPDRNVRAGLRALVGAAVRDDPGPVRRAGPADRRHD